MWNKFSNTATAVIFCMFVSACSTVGEVKAIAFDESQPLKSRIEKAMSAVCQGVFPVNQEVTDWYVDYGEKSVANARGFDKRVTNILRSARAARPMFDLEDRDLFNAKYQSLQESFSDYKEEVLRPLSGLPPKKCGEAIYCYEQSFADLTERADELEASMPAVPAQGLVDKINPISIVFNQAIGIAKGSCKDNLVGSMAPEYDEILSLELPEVSGL